MFLTVTPNAVLDLLLFLPQLRLGLPNPVERVVRSVGGKALDASVALHHLGQDSQAVCCLAGSAGEELTLVFARYPHLNPRIITVGGETRTAHILVESNGRHTHVFSGGLSLAPAHCDELIRQVEQLLPQSSFALTGGMLPAGLAVEFYKTMAEACSRSQKHLLIDSWGEPLLASLAAKPAVVKLNRDEFAWTFGNPTGTALDDLIPRARQTRRQYDIQALVITCGKDGLLAFTPDGDFLATPPPQTVLNAAGAGDAASAALAWRLADGDRWCSALTWAAAVSAASVLTEGTADLHLSDALNILPNVQLQALG